MKRSKNQGLIDFLTVESIEKAKIKNANRKYQPKITIVFWHVCP
jgi:hypothetical protein